MQIDIRKYNCYGYEIEVELTAISNLGNQYSITIDVKYDCNDDDILFYVFDKLKNEEVETYLMENDTEFDYDFGERIINIVEKNKCDCGDYCEKCEPRRYELDIIGGL